MKKLRPMLVLFLAIVVMVACGKDDDGKDSSSVYECETCSDQPIAVAAHDDDSGGIYKGIMIGSSGTVVFNINNTGDEITAILTLDGDVINLTAAVTWSEGQSYTAPFTGNYNGETISITFSVDATGQEATVVSSDIPGHPNAVFTIIKETSTLLIEAFEGSYHTTEPENGTFNIILSRDLGKWGGMARENNTNEYSDISGTITSSNKLIEDEGGIEVAVLEGDEINGSSVDDEGITITIHGERTL